MAVPVAICSTALAILPLNIHELPKSQPNRNIKLLDRVLDIRLHCDFRVNGQTLSDAQLDVMKWDGGATRLCSYCTFCHLLQDSLRRALHSQLPSSRNLGALQMEIAIERLECCQSRYPFATGQSVNPWDIHLVMRGHTILPLTSAVRSAQSDETSRLCLRSLVRKEIPWRSGSISLGGHWTHPHFRRKMSLRYVHG